jgi:hypothetical protein
VNYHIRLKGRLLSYSNGDFSASQRSPDVYLEDKETADKAVATGHFCYVEDADVVEIAEKSCLDAEQISSMKYGDVKILAADMGIDTSKIKKKAELVAAIVAEKVDYSDTDSEEVPDGIFA